MPKLHFIKTLKEQWVFAGIILIIGYLVCLIVWSPRIWPIEDPNAELQPYLQVADDLKVIQDKWQKVFGCLEDCDKLEECQFKVCLWQCFTNSEI